MLAVEPAGLSSIPGVHMVDGEKQCLEVVLCPPNIYIHIQIIITINVFKKTEHCIYPKQHKLLLLYFP